MNEVGSGAVAKEDLFDEDLEEGMVRMTFGEHLEDLRRRLILAVLGFLPGVLIGLAVGRPLMDVIAEPARTALEDYAENRRKARLAELYDARAAGEPVRREQLLLHINRDNFRDAFRQTFPDWQPPESGEASDDPKVPPREGDPPAISSPDRVRGSPVPQVKLLAEVDHTELEIAAESEYWRKAMITLGAQEGFMAYLKVSIVAGLVIASWWIIYQLWQFVAEGLYRHERSVVYRAMPLSIGLFLGGVVFCFYVVLPVVLNFFFGFNEWLKIEPNIRLSEWLSFATILPVIFGACFELPLVMLVLEKVGIFTLADYMSKWRHAILGIAIVAMIVTPTTDPGSMMLLMGPMTALYGLGLGMVYLRHVQMGDVPPLSRLAKVRLVIGTLVGVYVIVLLSGLFIPTRWLERSWWIEQVWKPGTLPTSYILGNRVPDDGSGGWVWGITFINALIIALVLYRLCEMFVRSKPADVNRKFDAER